MKCKYVKRIGESCTLNNNCKYPNCPSEEKIYTPIPLTEEWLIKFGFMEKYMSCHRRWTKNGIKIDQITDEDFEGGKIPQEQIFFYNDKEISYVHELKNLFFALTGEELQIRQKD